MTVDTTVSVGLVDSVNEGVEEPDSDVELLDEPLATDVLLGEGEPVLKKLEAAELVDVALRDELTHEVTLWVKVPKLDGVTRCNVTLARVDSVDEAVADVQADKVAHADEEPLIAVDRVDVGELVESISPLEGDTAVVPLTVAVRLKLEEAVADCESFSDIDITEDAELDTVGDAVTDSHDEGTGEGVPVDILDDVESVDGDELADDVVLAVAVQDS